MKFIRYASFCFLIIMSFTFWEDLKIHNVIEAGQKVNAIIIEMPNFCDCKGKYAKFKYNNFVFDSWVVSDFCKLYKLGDSNYFYHIKEYPDIFVAEFYVGYPHNSQLFSVVLIIILCIWAFFYSYKK